MEPEWARLALDEDFRALATCRKVQGIVAQKERLLYEERGSDDINEINRARGFLAGIKFILGLPAKEADSDAVRNALDADNPIEDVPTGLEATEPPHPPTDWRRALQQSRLSS